MGLTHNRPVMYNIMGSGITLWTCEENHNTVITRRVSRKGGNNVTIPLCHTVYIHRPQGVNTPNCTSLFRDRGNVSGLLPEPLFTPI